MSLERDTNNYYFIIRGASDRLKYQQYLKRDVVKNYFPLPNEIFYLGLCSGEIAVYALLVIGTAECAVDSR